MKTIVITGAASGIGLELTKQLLKRGDKVIALCRAVSPELKQSGAAILEGIDLTSTKMEEKVFSLLKNEKIDWLLNNAGIFENDEWGAIDPQNILKQFEINTLAPIKLTQALLPLMSLGSKIGITTSRMGSIEDNNSGGYYGYRISKAAVNMFGKGLSIDLAPQSIAVALMHPGYVKTKMTGFNGEITPEVSAKGLIAIMDKLDMKKTGGFWHTNGEELSW
ncbi:MAG: SDR family oxidoreductase [Bacteriovoracaceae bacterium]|nr:SDR family oxidoreductase [Bacteriovoracaceae bacterium]